MRDIYDRMICHVKYMGYQEVVFNDVYGLFCFDHSFQYYSIVDQTEGEMCCLFD